MFHQICDPGFKVQVSRTTRLLCGVCCLPLWGPLVLVKQRWFYVGYWCLDVPQRLLVLSVSPRAEGSANARPTPRRTASSFRCSWVSHISATYSNEECCLRRFSVISGEVPLIAVSPSCCHCGVYLQICWIMNACHRQQRLIWGSQFEDLENLKSRIIKTRNSVEALRVVSQLQGEWHGSFPKRSSASLETMPAATCQ